MHLTLLGEKGLTGLAKLNHARACEAAERLGVPIERVEVALQSANLSGIAAAAPEGQEPRQPRILDDEVVALAELLLEPAAQLTRHAAVASSGATSPSGAGRSPAFSSHVLISTSVAPSKTGVAK
jgi:hypothetical protein